MSEQEREPLIREFPVELTEGDGRTIEARIVPFNTPTRVADPPDYRPYTETWLPGAFDRQTGAADRVKVWLNFEHEQGIRGIVGHGQKLESRPDALYGVFRVHNNADGDKALELVREGLLGGVSLEAKALRSNQRDGIVERVRAHLDKVSLCREPAFVEAQVLAVREAATVDEAEEEQAPPEPSEVEQALARIGYEPLLKRAVTRKPWDGSASRFTDEQYLRSCLIDRGGDAPPKERASLPVLEPNGDLNANALGAAAAALSGARGGLRGVSVEQKATAARKLMRYYGMAGMDAPQSLRMMASR